MKKILFIDDNANLLEEILEALSFEGYDAFGASGGFEGIEIAKEIKPDLIICDILMPDIDGFEVYKQLRENLSTSLIPFIFLTALVEHNQIRKGMALGVDDYILKPISLRDLLNAISIRLQRSAEINQLIKSQFNEYTNRVLHILPHELLTPLNGILGLSDIVKYRTESLSRDEIKEMASNIESCGNRLSKAINNYLIYIKNISKDRLVIPQKLVHVHEIIADVSRRVAEEYDRVDDLIVQLEKAELMIEYDDLAFLIGELVNNAFKFSQPNSNVVVMTVSSDSQIEIRIKDHGVGFPVDNMSDIGAFIQFNRENLEQQGSGLGLITCMLIAQRYSGVIQITNSNVETIVKLIFPFST